MQAIRKSLESAQPRLLLGIAACLLMAACRAGETEPVDTSEAIPTVSAMSCSTGNALVGHLDGSVTASFNWDFDGMNCDSMLRPDRDGPRLRFSGKIDDANIAFILALPGLEAGERDVEIPTNITMQIEGSGRFFGTPDMQTCWTEVKTNTPVDENPERYRVEGVIFCVAPLGELNSSNYVDLTELAFTATVDWSDS